MKNGIQFTRKRFIFMIVILILLLGMIFREIGLAPSSTYKGFYYSAENAHNVFSVADKSLATMDIEGDLVDRWDR